MINSLRLRGCWALLLVALLFCPRESPAYSVFTHEELIDLAWNDSIRPFLLARFPTATEAQLKEAHAFAYGGCAIQDMGYYPFGKKFFSNLTHYVRTGDFIDWMLQNASTVNELAFAVGALSHYLGDSIGHAEAVNPATAINFPKLERKFGSSVTYGEDPHAHIRTEFAFDIGELTNYEFAPPAYLTFIGFRVPRRFLERAFAATYGFQLHEVFGKSRPDLRSYRTAVRSFIPTFAEGEVALHHSQFPPQPDDPAYHRFAAQVAHTNYERRWKHTYHGPGFKAHLIAVLIFLVPKVGAAADLAIKIPTPETQLTYLRSVNHSVDEFRRILKASSDDAPAVLANVDLDTGDGAKLGDYNLADAAYLQLLNRLTSKKKQAIPSALKQNILHYYEDGAKADDPPEIPAKVEERLEILRKMRVR